MNRRDAGLHLALAFPGGLDALSQRMNKRPDTLRKELTGVEGYKWGVADEELLIDMAIAARMRPQEYLSPITAAAVNAGAMVIPLPRDVDVGEDAMRCLAEAASEFGSFMHVNADAAADGRITGNELKNIDRECGRLVSLIQACASKMHALHESGKPNHLRAA